MIDSDFGYDKTRMSITNSEIPYSAEYAHAFSYDSYLLQIDEIRIFIILMQNGLRL